MLDPLLIQRIRAIFLHREPRVTIAVAADLLGFSFAEMKATIANGDIEVVETGGVERIEQCELAAYAMQQWPLTSIEEALERDAALVLPAALRTRTLTVRLPRYQIGVLQVLAGDGRETVETMLMRMFEELAELHHERLARVIPGLAEAMAWPADTAGCVGWLSRGHAFESERHFR
jgi:hypothetical protein